MREAYNRVFDELTQAAKEQDVPESILSDREATIHLKTSSNNILVLQNNLNADDFYSEQIGKIISYAKPQENTGDEDVPVKPEKQVDIRQASLQTKTKKPITNEAEIDTYLADLRQQLLKLLSGHDGVMITK